jgi:regulator of protease activity HflC (stomatin/prohibitin superfamily)
MSSWSSYDGPGPWTKFFVYLNLFAVLVVPFLLGYSFDTVHPRHMGLLFNQNTLEVRCDKLYYSPTEPSRYWLGIGHRFLEFPATHQVIRMHEGTHITSKTTEGAEVRMGLAVRYSLPKDAPLLCDMYFKFGEEWETVLIPIIRSAVRDVISEYSVRDMWEDREGVSTTLHGELESVLAVHNVTLESSQVLSLDIPAELANAITTTSVAAQAIETALYQKEAEQVSAVTRRLQAEQDANVLLEVAEGQAAAVVLEANATALTEVIAFETEAAAVNDVKSILGVNDTAAIQYVRMHALLANDGGARILYTSDSPIAGE